MAKIFPIELDGELRKQLKIAAIQEGLTLHDWIMKTLKEKIDDNGNNRNSLHARKIVNARRPRN